MNESVLLTYYSESPPGSPFAASVPGPSTAGDNDDSPPSTRTRPRKRARAVTPPDDDSDDDDSDDDDSDSDNDAGNLWRNSTDPDAEPFRMPFTPQRDPGFQLPRDQNWSPFDLFSLFFLGILLILLLRILTNVVIN